MSTKIPGYDYPPPAKGDFLDALRRVLGTEDGDRAWAHACDVAGLSPSLQVPGMAELTAVAAALVQMGGLRSVVGNSMSVRILTYEALARRTAGAAGGGAHE